jgi:hypothetical protein
MSNEKCERTKKPSPHDADLKLNDMARTAIASGNETQEYIAH